MSRRSRHSKGSTDGSWVVESDGACSEFSSSEPDSGSEAQFVSTSRLGIRSSRTNSNVKQEQDYDEALSAESLHHSPLHRLPRKTKRSDEPALVMPSLTIQQSPAPAQSSRRIAADGSGSQIRQRHSPKHKTSWSKQQPRARTSTQHDRETDDPFYSRLMWSGLVQPVLMYSASLLGSITAILKPIIAVILAVWMLAVVSRQLLNSAITRALSPICQIPGVSSFNLAICAAPIIAAGPVEFDQLMAVQSNFEDVLSASTTGVSLPADMKRSESSIRDLRQVVQFSTLPSRNELVFEFGGFIDTARQASSDLTRFNSRIGSAVDNVLSTNRWTLQVIDGVAEKEASRGSMSRMFQEIVLYPFQGGKLTQDLLLEQYLRHTRVIEDRIGNLIGEAQTLLGVLQNLDDRLDLIQTITTRDGINVKGSREELLAQLWTRLGGNRSSKKKHEEQLRLLQQVTIYRKTAWDHVSATLLKLQSISAGLEDLRERVAAPEILGSNSQVTLRMHIEHIELGIERLEAQRSEARKVESDYQRKLLDKTGSSQLSIS